MLNTNLPAQLEPAIEQAIRGAHWLGLTMFFGSLFDILIIGLLVLQGLARFLIVQLA